MIRERIHESNSDNQAYFEVAAGLQVSSPSRKNIPKDAVDMAEQLLLSSSSLDPIDATLSPKRTKHLPRHNKELLESLKGPKGTRPQIQPASPFHFVFGKNKDPEGTRPTPQSADNTSGSSSSSQELLPPPTTTPSKRLKEIRPAFHSSGVIPSSPKPKPFRPESSPELPDVQHRTQPTQGSPTPVKNIRSKTPPEPLPSSIPPPLPTEDSHASQSSASYALRPTKQPRGSVPSSAISQEGAPIPPNLPNESSAPPSQPRSTPHAAHKGPTSDIEPSQASSHHHLSHSRSRSKSPDPKRRLQSSEAGGDKSDGSSEAAQRRSSPTTERRSTRGQKRGLPRNSSNRQDVEESCLPRDEAEEEMLSQHSQRTVPKQMTSQGRVAAHDPLYSANALFRGLKFFITGLQPMNETEAEEYDGNLREKVCEWLTIRGGVVEDDIERLHPRDRKCIYPEIPSIILISDRARTTIKYLSALAAGIPCIHYSWLEHCIDSKSIVPCQEYLLPAGFSQSLQKIVTHEEFTQPNALDGLRVEILGGSPYVNIWSKIIRAAGGKCVRRLFTPDEEHIDVICSPEEYLITVHIRNKADELQKPLVSLNWIKQCLIDRRLMPFRPYVISPPKK